MEEKNLIDLIKVSFDNKKDNNNIEEESTL